MKTCKKSFFAILLTLCLCVGAFALTACGDKDKGDDSSDTITYTVTVKTDEATPASGVGVTVKKGSASFATKDTGTDGKVTFALAADTYTIALSKLPENYAVPERALEVSEQNPSLTVTLVRSGYKVTLVNPDNTPFYSEGVQVGICKLDGGCEQPVDIGTNGETYIAAEKGDYHVQIIGLPKGYIYECDADGYYTGKNFSTTDTEMTIVVYPITDVFAGNPMTTEEKTAFKAIDNIVVNGFETTMNAYNIKQAKVAASASVYFAVTPSISGKFRVFSVDNLNYYFYGTTFTPGVTSTFVAQYLVLEAGKTYYFAATNIQTADEALNFAIAVPSSSYIVHNGVGGEVNLTLGKAGDNAIIEFHPTAAGKYTLTAKGTASAYIANSDSLPEDTATVDEGDFAAGKSIEIDYSAKSLARSVATYFAVQVKADKYPATITVEFAKTGNSEYTYEYAEVTETLAPYTKENGTELYGVAMDGSAVLVYNETDGFYHLDTEDGKVVVVMITEAIDGSRFAEGSTLAYMDKGDMPVTYEFIDGTNTTNYTEFIRGFEEYDLDGRGRKIIPEYIETEHYYAKYVNEDGVYPLTKELETFLKNLFAANSRIFSSQIPEDANPTTCGWMFPLYYYDVETVADPICGEYNIVKYTDSEGEHIPDGENIPTNVFSLTISKNGSFVISAYGRMGLAPVYSGTWNKTNDTTYTLTIPEGTQDENWNPIDLNITLTYNSTTETVILTCIEEEMNYGITEWTFAKNN